MGIIVQGKGLWDALFTRTQRQLLSLFFGYPERSFYANEIVRRAGVGTGSVQRELTRLASVGLVTVTRIGNQKHYQANPNAPIFPELRSIVLKTYGWTEQLRAAIEALPGSVSLARVSAQHLDPAVSELDLLLVSDEIDLASVVRGLEGVESRIGRRIRPQVFTTREFRDFRAQGNAELLELLRQPGIVLAG